mmetsp:Transcript_52978/g.124102  ORF Transcript_52978/g.124102 Transcript_52978/m.124102 type:complete len:557 (+) Transcript_52978:58-1728(+)
MQLYQPWQHQLCPPASVLQPVQVRSSSSSRRLVEPSSQPWRLPAARLLLAAPLAILVRETRRERCARGRSGIIRRAVKEGTRVKISEGSANFYEVLGVARDATQEEIRSAYRTAVRNTHPDVNPAEDAMDQFLQVQEAFRWLSDPGQREVYDGVGSKFGEDALYDYTDEPILGTLTKVREIEPLTTAYELVNLCRKDLTWKRPVKIDHEVSDKRARFRKYGVQRIQFVKNYFCRELKKALAYPKLMKRLHPFERLSVELGLHTHWKSGGLPFGKLLAAVRDLRKKIHEEGSWRSHACARAERGRLATFIADEAIQEMYEIMESHEPVLQQFLDAQRTILKTPQLDLDKPTIVFVGAPNVGKSSLVRSLSTGIPEVNDYAFTTKQLTVGHLWHFIAGTPLLVHGQIVDSPGLRGPPSQKDNLLDQLTWGSLKHLPTGVVFVFDPYPDTHGLLSIDDQIKLREALRERFPRRPWLDVITRIDIPEAESGVNKLAELYPAATLVSALEGTGLDVLNMEVRRLLEEMTKVVRQLQRAKIRQLRMGRNTDAYVGKEALTLR